MAHGQFHIGDIVRLLPDPYNDLAKPGQWGSGKVIGIVEGKYSDGDDQLHIQFDVQLFTDSEMAGCFFSQHVRENQWHVRANYVKLVKPAPAWII